VASFCHSAIFAAYGPSAESFHRHHDRQIEPLSHCLDAAEEPREALLLVHNFKLVE
jgi:hypothetical protein